MRNLIKMKTEDNVVYIGKKQKDTMDLRCSNCNVVKNEGEIIVEVDKETGFKKYKCECGSSSFVPQMDLEEIL